MRECSSPVCLGAVGLTYLACLPNLVPCRVRCLSCRVFRAYPREGNVTTRRCGVRGVAAFSLCLGARVWDNHRAKTIFSVFLTHFFQFSSTLANLCWGAVPAKNLVIVGWTNIRFLLSAGGVLSCFCEVGAAQQGTPVSPACRLWLASSTAGLPAVAWAADGAGKLAWLVGGGPSVTCGGTLATVTELLGAAGLMQGSKASICRSVALPDSSTGVPLLISAPLSQKRNARLGCASLAVLGGTSPTDVPSPCGSSRRVT